ncbi:hypothetical protein [Methanobrevibacter sp.]|uniref:hypothetical protein n=1 Tax=Methanobrevibacter sp. TaxID=66852 RepID=UPI00388E7ECE
MVFVFSIGMLRQFMPKKEIVLVLGVAFLIGAIGGAFFLQPIYQELPEVVSLVEKNVPGNEETMYLDLSSSINMNELKQNLSKTEGFVSFEETDITIPLWKFNDREKEYFEYVLGNIDSHFNHYNVTSDGKLQIQLEDNYSSYDALKSFSDWYKLVYGSSLSYAQIHAKLIVSSSEVESFQKILMDRGIVASKMEGPVQTSVNNTNSSMVSNVEFVLATGVVGLIVATIGIYYDSIGVFFRRFKKSMREKRKR